MRRRTLSLRWWLALSVLLAGLFSLIATIVLSVALNSGGAAPTPVMVLQSRLIREYRSWQDPTWQQQLTQELTRLDVAVLLSDPSGRVVFQSTPDPLSQLQASAGRYNYIQDDLTVAESHRSVDLFEVRQGDAVLGSMRLYAPWPSARGPGWDLRPFGMALLVIGFGTALAIAAMLRIFVPPLRALAAAAGQVREGDLDFTLRRSPVRELDAVLGAFTQMAQGLQELTYRQAAMDEERRFFLAAISHDLRTPLFSLRGRLEGIRDGIAATPEQARRYADVALKTLSALERLVNDLFAYTRLNLLAMAPGHEALDWMDVLRQTAETMQPVADAKGVLLLLPGQTACRGTGDAQLLGRVIANLVANAIRHTPTGGQVSIGLACTSTESRIWVADTGTGIDPQLLPRLFTPLIDGQAPRSFATGGTGLGLVIARAVIEAHGGEITAANLPGGGACFTIMLPAVVRA